MVYEAVIGLEVHSQLLTKSKMFCSCGASYQDTAPNTMVCQVCMGMPGVLPTVNRRAVELVIAMGLALDCTIAKHTKFDRKNYPYPDLMKGYQISQYDQPIASDGGLLIEIGGSRKTVGITRVHLEEDVAKLFHRSEPNGDAYSLLDVNRAGVPLMEIVSEPDISTADEARIYLTELHSILRYVGASTANMEEGNFRCDANISVRPRGSIDLGVRVEVKNMNSFRAVHDALEYEIDRQTRLVSEDKTVVQETRGWVDDRRVTVSQRSKEYASDYRYFPDPDLPPLVINESWVESIREKLPELPQVRRARFVEEYGLNMHDSRLMNASKSQSDYFEEIIKMRPDENTDVGVFAKEVSNWILGELSRLLNESRKSLKEAAPSPGHFVELLVLVDAQILNIGMAKTVFEEMFNSGESPKVIVEELDLVQISDTDTVQSAVGQAIDSNPKPVSDYLGGKEGAIRFLVGQVMKLTKGKANPQLVTILVKEKLESMR